ncbi:extracellular matrix/biofilm biosynthesis regulator RemA family protein [Proteiniclasticum sp. QWL-01]|uniref:extracellular matrix regulator RemB n=1 Tax=Proteiniclasticum sp. QWL-01 TaxID=3036945 RepID=UPI002410804F|nr:extracellular matrix/biofilm biosynthesis regulator RemA family protein [Proteiniclasticum sp. QWL-01]WFF72879.1 DUF370 domain-containing protein [Proteiniclasticum sp. QWL-01]
MILHLGENISVQLREIIGIFNLENNGNSSDNLSFLKTAGDEGFIHQISDDPPKSFVVAEKDHKSIVYLSPISTQTLIRRAQSAFDQEETNHGR